MRRHTPIYIASPAGPLSVQFSLAFEAAGWHLHQTLVWVKDALVLGHADHQYRHEPILYGWRGKGRPWYGGRDQSSVFEVARPKRSIEHPTMKPVALVEAQLRNSSARGALGYDPFCGSGTTVIAAERLGRRCAAVELDPRYVDAAVQRWEQYTGQSARLHDDGQAFAEIEEARRGR
jgi:DNA modification methylase